VFSSVFIEDKNTSRARFDWLTRLLIPDIKQRQGSHEGCQNKGANLSKNESSLAWGADTEVLHLMKRKI
jgi:hypothetical protein